jgi:uroporphyrinogen-III decarboxylase
MGFSRILEGIHQIRSIEKMFLDFFQYPNDLKALIARFASHQRDSIHLLAQAGCDAVMGYDDFGLQDRLMISLEMFVDFFLPHYRENWSLAHELGMDVFLHSCGHITALLPELIDAGLDVIQMDQQENMGLEELSKLFGGKLAFWCPVDIQNTQATAEPQDVINYVKKMMQTLGHHDGGLISMTYTTPEAINLPPENVSAMCKAFRTYGVYH